MDDYNANQLVGFLDRIEKSGEIDRFVSSVIKIERSLEKLTKHQTEQNVQHQVSRVADRLGEVWWGVWGVWIFLMLFAWKSKSIIDSVVEALH